MGGPGHRGSRAPLAARGETPYYGFARAHAAASSSSGGAQRPGLLDPVRQSSRDAALDRVGRALVVAERVRVAVSGNTGDGSDSLIQIPVKISMGVAELNEHGSLDTLTRDADAALYRAKNAGRDAVSD